MGKIKVKKLGLEESEKEQKKAAKIKREQKNLRKNAGKEVGVVIPEAKDTLKKEEVKNEQKSVDETVLEGESSEAEVTKSKSEEDEPSSAKASAGEGKSKRKKAVKAHVYGKKYRINKAKVDKSKKYSVVQAVTIIKTFKSHHFDESVELHATVNTQNLKGEVSLPHGTGKTLQVTIADDKLIESLEKGIIAFDVLIATPAMMPKLVKYAKILGPKGLMPNPKQGTVTDKPEEALTKFQKGLTHFKTEGKFPLMHVLVGKKSYEEKQLIENINALIGAISKPKILKLTLSASMSPSVELEVK